MNTFACIKELLGNRMLLGVYIGQYCINTLTYFFLTWFPVYLVPTYPGDRDLFASSGFQAWMPKELPVVRAEIGEIMELG